MNCPQTGMPCLPGCTGNPCLGLNVPLNKWPQIIADTDNEKFGAVHMKLFQELQRMQRQAGDVARYPIDCDGERLPYLIQQVMDSAHAILDYAHEFKQAALKANP